MKPRLREVFPTAFSIGNLLCGFLALYYIVQGYVISAAWLIIVAWFLDGFDGKVARFIGSTSRFGVELDSLADLCSFGLAPTFLIFQTRLHVWRESGIAIGFLFFACGAIRLARFNVQSGSSIKESFVGLPIPAAAVTIASYLLFSQGTWSQLQSMSFSGGLMVALSLLMISTFEYDALKFSLDSWWDRCKMGILLGGALMVALFPSEALFPLSMIYASSGIVRWIVQLLGGERAVAGFPNR